MIQELADYEKESDAVEATVESLQATIAFAPADAVYDPNSVPVTEPTSPTRPSRCLLLVEPDGNVVGMALYFYNYSTWRSVSSIYLEDLFVLPGHRGRGIGRALLAHLARLAVERGCGRFEWSVLDWNAPAIGFYRSLGAVPMDDWTIMRVSGESLARLAGEDG